MRRATLSSVCSLALLIGGCPKRQTNPRVVYVPSPPPEASPAPQEPAGTLVIEEPSAPEPSDVTPRDPTTPRPSRRRPRPLRAEPPAATEPVAEPVETPPPEVPAPALEPRETPEQQAALRQQVADLQAQLQGRIAQLGRSRLSETDRTTLEDARMFLGQSERALEVGDLQRSLNLARKASLLVSAVETKP